MISNTPRARGVVAASPIYYGWVVWLVATIGIIATAPGQSFTVSLFIDSFIADFGLSRTEVSALFSGGTFAASLCLTFVGRMIDRYGNRTMAVLIGAVFATVLVLFSFVNGMWTLLIAFFGIRMLGQGSLGLVNSTVIVEWFKRLRGRVISMTFVSFAVFQAIYIPWLQRQLEVTDWRTMWIILAAGVFVATVPLAWLFMRNTPEEHGLLPDGDDSLKKASDVVEALEDSWELAEAIKNPTFWIFLYGRIISAGWGTGIIFHQISLFGELGHEASTTANTFGIITLITAAASISFGYFVDKGLRPQLHMPIQLSLLVSAMILATFMSSQLLLVPYALSFGFMMGASGVFDGSVWVNVFGRKYQGSIRGFVSTMMVVGTSIGPILFGLSFDLFASYAPVLWLGVALSVMGIIGAYFAPSPRKRKPKRG